MKFIQNKTFPKVLAAVCGGMFIVGCATGGGNPAPLGLSQTGTVTNYVTVTNTHDVVIYSTNAQNLVTTQTVHQVVLETNSVQVPVYGVAPVLDNGLKTLQTLNSASAPVNPFSVPIGMVLSVVSGGLGLYAKLKSKQAATHASIASTLVKAIESQPDAVGDAVKTAVADLSKTNGTSQLLHDFVQKVTG